MEVQSGAQQPEPLGSPRSGANQQNELGDGQTNASGRSSTDNHSKDVQPASKKDDKKPSAAVRGYHSNKSAAMSPGLGSNWATGSGGGHGAWNSPSFACAGLQHYLSHQQHPHHRHQSTHTSYAYCPAHPAPSSSSSSPTAPPLALLQPSLEFHISGHFWETPTTEPANKPQETKPPGFHSSLKNYK